MASPVVRQWLSQVLAVYTHRQPAFAQLVAALDAYPTLSPKTESFTFDDGRAALLVCLAGTLPVSYRAARYNIPLAVWIVHGFPLEPPIVYLTPTPEMVIRKGPHVEPGGKCSGDYLHAWSSKPESCTLLALLESLQDVFSREPPLYAKPKPPPPSASPSPSPPSGPPRPPPRPPSLARPPAPSSSLPDPALRPPPLYSRGPSSSSLHAPHHPTTTSQPQPIRPAHSIQATSFETYRSAAMSSSHPHSSPQATAAQKPEPLVHRLAALQLTRQQPNFLDDPPPPPAGTLTRATSNPPPPPRPPNPALVALRSAVHAKLQAELAALTNTLTFEHGQLVVLQHDLLKGEPAILDEISRLEAVREVCVGVGYRYETLVSELRERIDELAARQKTPVDELVCSNTVLYNQLLELLAEDQAIEDTIYHLARALNNSDTAKIDLDKFLKRVRALGREQFLKRSIINRVTLELAAAGGM